LQARVRHSTRWFTLMLPHHGAYQTMA